MSAQPEDWQPACTLQALRVRAAMLRSIREFFHGHSYMEVETPCLSRDIVVDAHLEPFQLTMGKRPWFLQTSPEAHMKRLLAAGSGSIFQISRVFRNDEWGDRHNHEFSMIEWYGVGSTWAQQLNFTEGLVRTAIRAVAETGAVPPCLWPETPFTCTTYAQAFKAILGLDIHQANVEELQRAARMLNIPLPETGPDPGVDDLRNLLLAVMIEPQLGVRDGREFPEFLCDYPPTQAALAVVTDTEPPVARRFELYIRGIELCNGYQELTDSVELGRRDLLQNQGRKLEDRQELPGAPRLLSAMQAGLPDCSGVALGFDRLVMIATGAAQIGDVMPFPGNRA
jgi:lysyl-tRNA synthetase class 2